MDRHRYMAFAFDQYYPEGGTHDLIGSVRTIEEAKVLIERMGLDFGHIFDLDTMAIVATWSMHEVRGHPAGWKEFNTSIFRVDQWKDDENDS